MFNLLQRPEPVRAAQGLSLSPLARMSGGGGGSCDGDGDSAGGAGGSASIPSPGSPTFSELNYPKGASMYIVGELHVPQGTKEGNEQTLVQKLLQAERSVRILLAKEGKDVQQCILGVIFFSSKLTLTFGKRLGNALVYYKDCLPCMWELSKLGRFLGCTLKDVHYSAPIMRLELQLQRGLGSLKGEFESQFGKVNGRLDKVEEKLGKLEEKLDALLARKSCCAIV